STRSGPDTRAHRERGRLMDPFRESTIQDYVRAETRRQFFARGANVLCTAALASLLGDRFASAKDSTFHGAVAPHFAPKAKQVIYLHMVGGPSQMDLYDYKPKMG